MVADGCQYLLTNPVLSFAPGLAIMLVVFAFNMIGDGLRDTLDPRLRGLL
jgi:peptide/nickel transport system permease protein